MAGLLSNFRNTIILMTSNVGSETIKKQSTLGFSPITDESSYESMREKIMEEAKRKPRGKKAAENPEGQDHYNYYSYHFSTDLLIKIKTATSNLYQK